MTTQRFSQLIRGVDCHDIAECGGKAHGLSRAARVVRVPPFLVVPTEWFRVACADVLPALDEMCLRLVRGGSADPDEVRAEVAGLFSGVALPTPMRERLAAAVHELGGGRSLAVRSSATTEDGSRSAEAGLYDSVLNVEPAAVASAVVRCWASAYSPRALRNKLLRGALERPEMAVVVQPMVPARQAGVAFSAGPDHVVVERVRGLADDLVAGRVAPDSHVVVDAASDTAPELRDVREAVLRLRAAFGGDVDVEWVWDGRGVHVVQARDVTSVLPIAFAPEEYVDGPVLRTAELYGPAEDVLGLDLGAVAGVYTSYRRKRLALTEVAAKHGCAAGTAIVLRCNRAGLATPGWPGVLARLGRRVVIDAGADARQIIAPVEDVTYALLDRIRANAGHDTPVTVLVREFTAGDVGAISHVTDGSLHVEWSPDGLLAINRGLATRLHRFVVRHGVVTGQLPEDWNERVVRTVRAVTEEFGERGDCLVEWVSEGEELRAIDYSAVDGAFASDVFERATVISGGSCRGPALVVGSGMFDDLESASVAPVVSVSEALPFGGVSHIAELHAQVAAAPEPPVVVVDRPFAILALLIGSVAGFVFRGQASMLCHLSILLREHGVPAVSVPDFEVEQGRVLNVLGNGEVRVEVPRA